MWIWREVRKKIFILETEVFVEMLVGSQTTRLHFTISFGKPA